MKNKRLDAEKLLQKAMDESLTAAERAQLEAFQNSTDGQIYVSTHNQLSEDVPPNIPEFTMSDRQLDAVATQINKQLQSKRRTRRIVTTTRNLALATAVFIILFLGINWLVYHDYQPEPAAAPVTAVTRSTAIITPTPTPQPTPTPTLAPGMSYVNLNEEPPQPMEQLPPDLYQQTVARTAAQVGYDLILPTQLNKRFSYVGAMANPDTHAVEIALTTATRIRGLSSVYIFSQLPLTEDEENRYLTTTYLPFADLEAIRIESRAEKVVDLFGAEAEYEAREFITPDIEWNVVNTLAWQAEGRQFTLTLIVPTIIPVDTMKTIVEEFHLANSDP